MKTFEDSTLHGTLCKKNFFRKNCPKTCSKHVWTHLETILVIFGIWKFFDFFENFRSLNPAWNTGQKNFKKNCPKTCSKQVWTILGTILGIFGILKTFWFFWKFWQTWPSMEHWAKNFFWKIAPKHVQSTFEQFWERFWTFFEFSKLIFLKTFEDTALQGTLGKFFFRKNCPKTCSKHIWTLLGTILGIFGFLKNFDFFEKFRRLDPPWNTGQKKFLKNCPKTCSKHVWTLLGTIFGILGILKNFDFFENFRRLDPPWNTGQKKNSEKLHQNMLKTRLGTFGNDFGHFCNFENFLIFLKIFADLTLHGTLGRKNSKKLPQNMFKKRLDTFGNDFWHFWNFEKFLIFLKGFEDLTPHETLGKKKFWKAAPKQVQSTCEQFWERFWTFFGIFKNDFFENFRRHDPPWSTGQIFFSEKLPQNMFKTRLNTIGNDFGHFRIFEKKLIFLKTFEDTTLHGALGNFFFRKNCPKTCSKHVWTLLGTILGIFGFSKKIWFFWKLSKTGPSMEHWAKKISEKWPQNMFKTRLNTIGNDFRHFGNFEKFWFFWKLSKTGPSMEHWAEKKFGKIAPKHVKNTFGHFWERFWAFL